MDIPSREVVSVFQDKVLSWYKKHKRFLPWRETNNPYCILVSEVMSQQTQVDRVIAYYDAWLRKYPDVYVLATTDTKTLLSLWSGLGYNSRALRLRECAGLIVQRYGGFVPDDYDELVSLPGIGDYTANAVLAFAFNKDVPVLDTNIRRVLIDEFDLPENLSYKELQEVASLCVVKGKSREWHNALMDYGALHRTARTTGIRPLSRQGKFEGSDREVRGFITRELTKKDFLSINFVSEKFPDKDVKKIVEKMVEDKFVSVVGKKVILL